MGKMNLLRGLVEDYGVSHDVIYEVLTEGGETLYLDEAGMRDYLKKGGRAVRKAALPAALATGMALGGGGLSHASDAGVGDGGGSSPIVHHDSSGSSKIGKILPKGLPMRVRSIESLSPHERKMFDDAYEKYKSGGIETVNDPYFKYLSQQIRMQISKFQRDEKKKYGFDKLTNKEANHLNAALKQGKSYKEAHDYVKSQLLAQKQELLDGYNSTGGKHKEAAVELENEMKALSSMSIGDFKDWKSKPHKERSEKSRAELKKRQADNNRRNGSPKDVERWEKERKSEVKQEQKHDNKAKEHWSELSDNHKELIKYFSEAGKSHENRDSSEMNSKPDRKMINAAGKLIQGMDDTHNKDMSPGDAIHYIQSDYNNGDYSSMRERIYNVITPKTVKRHLMKVNRHLEGK